MGDHSPLHSAPSTLSIESGHSHSTRATSRPSSRLSAASGLVKVDVKLHLEPEEPAHFQIAAALAESARQLAQSAANFEQEDMLRASSFHSPRSTGSFSRSLAEHHMPRYLSHHPTSTSALTRNHHSASALTRARKNSLPVATLDHPVITPNFDRPTNTVSLDRPTNTVSLDRPTNTVSLDRPIATAILDRSGSMDHTTNLGRAERSERVRRASTASDSPLSRNYSSLSDYKYDTRTGAFSRVNGTGHFYEPAARKMRAELHTPNGVHHYPKSLRHVHTTGSLPRPLEGSTLEQASIHAESDAGSKSGSGCDSNASTLKAMPRSASSGRRNSEDTVEEAVQHSRQLSLLSEQASLESSASLQDALQQTPPSQQEAPSPPSLSRAGSALSLEPALSSTASGYAATGSTSSLENSDSLQAKQKAGTVPIPELSRAGETTAAESLFGFHGGFLEPALHHSRPPFSMQTGALNPPFNLTGSETIDI